MQASEDANRRGALSYSRIHTAIEVGVTPGGPLHHTSPMPLVRECECVASQGWTLIVETTMSSKSRAARKAGRRTSGVQSAHGLHGQASEGLVSSPSRFALDQKSVSFDHGVIGVVRVAHDHAYVMLASSTRDTRAHISFMLPSFNAHANALQAEKEGATHFRI